MHAQRIGRTFLGPLDVRLEPGLVVQPDILVVPAGELRRRSDTVRHLLLAVEAVSPSSARHDPVRKRPAYQRNRVPEYWILDDRSETFERWTPDDERPEIISEQFVWQPTSDVGPFVLELSAFFDEIRPEPDDA